MMRYSNIRLRAGLVALVFVLIISLVSAVPIPATESGLSSAFSPRSNPSLNGHDIQRDSDAARITEISLSGQMSTLPAATRSLTRRPHISTNLNMDDQLVRRESIAAKIRHAFQSLGHKIKSGFQKFGSLVRKGFQKAGKAIKKGFQKFGGLVKKGFQKVKQGFQTAGRAIKKGFQKVGKAIVKAAKKVWHFVKTTGAKIAKFGLKVIESVGEVAGKVIGFIPGIGKPIQYALHGLSKVAGVLSDKIHVKLPPKLEKGMKVMDKANKIMSYIPRRRDLSEEEAFQQRDISEAYYFEERDDIALENRDESYFEVNERNIYERYYDLD